MSTKPKVRRYSETFPGRGAPLGQIPGFLERAMQAGAPMNATVHMKEEPDALFGMIAPSAVVSATWPYEDPDA